MSKIVRQSHITITREKGPTRCAEIKGFDKPVFYGVHGGKNFIMWNPRKNMRPRWTTSLGRSVAE